MKARRGPALLFAGCAAAVVAAMAWVTRDVLAFERSEAASRADAAHQETLRLALWRMDTWLAPALAAETGGGAAGGTRLVRAVYGIGFDGAVRPVERGDPSAEMACRAIGVTDNFARLAAAEQLANEFALAGANGGVPAQNGAQAPAAANGGPLAARAASPAVPTPPAAAGGAQAQSKDSGSRNLKEYGARGKQSQMSQNYAGTASNGGGNAGPGLQTVAPATGRDDGTREGAPAGPAAAGSVATQTRSDPPAGQVLATSPSGPQTPAQSESAGPAPFRAPPAVLWVTPPGASPELVLVRRHDVSLISSGWLRDGATVFVLDWPAVQAGLREQVADLVSDVSFRALENPLGDAQGFALATVPVAVDAPCPPAEPVPLVTPARTTLAVAWLAVLASIGAVAFAVRRALDLSERRRRFASSVTHELRTPLTTFRLYSEMLADGMVTDPAARQTYLETLRTESSRLAHLVENVLSYARVEEGRMAVRRERIAVGDLLVRVTPPLERRAREAGATLVVDADGAPRTVVEADPDLVGQILFNLVDNACKYAADAADRRIDVTAAPTAGGVRIAVRDRGPGLPPGRAAGAFAPFERAGRPAGDAVPGIGLGLALSRALARDLGGDLVHETPADGGAQFVLTLRTDAAR